MFNHKKTFIFHTIFSYRNYHSLEVVANHYQRMFPVQVLFLALLRLDRFQHRVLDRSVRLNLVDDIVVHQTMVYYSAEKRPYHSCHCYLVHWNGHVHHNRLVQEDYHHQVDYKLVHQMIADPVPVVVLEKKRWNHHGCCCHHHHNNWNRLFCIFFNKHIVY